MSMENQHWSILCRVLSCALTRHYVTGVGSDALGYAPLLTQLSVTSLELMFMLQL